MTRYLALLALDATAEALCIVADLAHAASAWLDRVVEEWEG